jgi:DNA-binding LacI/PurR family transcriptional regulator
MGQLATELLLERISGELPQGHRELILPIEIIVRESCGPNKSD